MIVDFYSLFLLEFEDDGVVFSQAQLDAFNRKISEALGRSGHTTDGWYRVRLTGHEWLRGLEVEPVHAELGYYHHRLIIQFRVEIEPSKLRSIRERLHPLAKRLFEEKLKDAMNEVAPPEGTIHGAASYPFIVVREGAFARLWTWMRGIIKGRPFPFNGETTSLSFEVLEPVVLGARHHLLRISIGGTTLYAQRASNPIQAMFGTVGDDLLRDLINGIYQYCLYPVKLEKEKGKDTYRIDETILIRLWEHIIETTGGSTAQIIGARFNVQNLILAFVALLASILALDFWR